jgi:hypothetical protein
MPRMAYEQPQAPGVEVLQQGTDAWFSIIN